MIVLLIRQGFDAGELFAFEELEAGSAAGGDVGDLVGDACVVDGSDGVAAAQFGHQAALSIQVFMRYV